ncbi:MAG: SRPBCC domain-containing protein [Microbacterium sp.]
MIELTEEALVAATPDVVWADFTDARLLAEWLWPARFETAAVVDPRPLGRWEVRSAPSGMAVLGEILALEKPRSLRLRWRWDGEDDATDVAIAFEPAADGATRVIVRHSGFVTDEERASHVEGWSNCLQRLVERHA